MLDILIKNGRVIDGSGAARRRADVGVEEARIVAVEVLEAAEAATVIDAAGCVVAPGFVDMHSHADFTLPLNPTADSMVRQGITTAVIGQCGSTPVPLLAETREQVLAVMGDRDPPLPWERWDTFRSYLDDLAHTGISLNVIPLVGQGMVRAGVVGFGAELADAQQLARMQAEVIKAMDEGAIGLSTGLIYPPGSYASTEELVALTQPVGERDGFYFSHIRGEGDTLLEAVAEAIRIGRETGAAVEIAHFKAAERANWPKSAQALALINQAREEGLDVTADMYPYLAGSTSLSATLPTWAHEGGKAQLLARLADPETRRTMAHAMQQPGNVFQITDWADVQISRCPKYREYEGQRVAALADAADQSPFDWVFDTLLKTELDVGMVNFHSSEENRRQEIIHPALMFGTDGSGLATEGVLSKGVPHPRNYGTFPRVLAHYVRELDALSLETAIWKMSGLPAQKLRWRDRGAVKRGYQADLVVFNPDTVQDMATYTHPHQYPQGIHHVIVNGTLVMHDDAHTRARPGCIL